MPFPIKLTSLLFLGTLSASMNFRTLDAALIDDASGEFFSISDGTLASNGLLWLDSSFGQNQPDATAAIANAQVDPRFTNVRLPTIAEWDDLFVAANIPGVSAADAFAVGATIDPVVDGNASVGELAALFGFTQTGGNNRVLFYTDPDVSGQPATTRDLIFIYGSSNPSDPSANNDLAFYNTSTSGAVAVTSFPLVADAVSNAAVPEPSSALLLTLSAGVGAVLYSRKRKALGLQPAPNAAA